MDLASQLYMITGILSIAILLLLAFTIVLAMQLKKEKRERMANESRYLTAAAPSIHRGEELERRGYGMYQGDPEPPVPRSVHRQDSRNHDSHYHHEHHQPSHQHSSGNLGSIPSLHQSQYHGMQQQQPHSGIHKSKSQGPRY